MRGRFKQKSSAEATAQTSSDLRIRQCLDGDSCTVRKNPDGITVPGAEKDGSCCSSTDPKDCTIILKPFPGAVFAAF